MINCNNLLQQNGLLIQFREKRVLLLNGGFQLKKIQIKGILDYAKISFCGDTIFCQLEKMICKELISKTLYISALYLVVLHL